MTFEHLHTKKSESDDILKNFVGIFRGKLFAVIQSPDADITFLEASPESDIFRVTFHLTSHRPSYLVSLWHETEGRMRNDMNHFIITYHDHIFTPRKESLAVSYYNKNHTAMNHHARLSFTNLMLMTAIVIIIGFSMAGLLMTVKAKRARNRPTSCSRDRKSVV